VISGQIEPKEKRRKPGHSAAYRKAAGIFGSFALYSRPAVT
jgi:hypothetical protein